MRMQWTTYAVVRPSVTFSVVRTSQFENVQISRVS
jgi:hypothetical protein